MFNRVTSMTFAPRHRRQMWLVLLGVVAALWSSASPVAATPTAADPLAAPLAYSLFHCQRPFAALASMSQLSKEQKRSNCDFTYFIVSKAGVVIDCEAPAPSSPALVCNVTARVTFSVPWDLQRRLAVQMGTVVDYVNVRRVPATQPPRYACKKQDTNGLDGDPLLAEDDAWRYSLNLRAKGNSTVSYKGFDGEGYSVCCEGMQESHCAWETATRADGTTTSIMVLGDCPLPTIPQRTEEAESTVSREAHFVVHRPLHRFVEGPWVLQLQLWRRRPAYLPVGTTAPVEDSNSEPTEDHRETLGRVNIPFHITASDLWASGHVRVVPHHTTATDRENPNAVVEVLPANPVS